MSSFEAVIERIKQEGQLTRNTGTNSLKAMNKNLEQILEVLNKNFSILKTNNDDIKSIDKKTPKVSVSSEFTTERKGGILAGLSAAITGNTIGRFGIGSTGKAQDVRRATDNFVGKITGREKRQEIAEKLFSLSDSKIKKEESEETSNEPVVEAVEEQTNILKKLVSLFEKGMFKEKQKELKEEDLEDEKLKELKERKAGVVKEKESDGKSGILSSLMKFGSVIGAFGSVIGAILPNFGKLKNVIKGILAISGIKMILDAAGGALTAGAGLGKTLIKTLLMNALPYIFNPAVLGLLGGAAIAYLINMLLTSEGVGAEAMDKLEKKKLENATAANDEAAATAAAELTTTGKVSHQTEQALSETEYAKNFYQKKQDARERVLKLSEEEFKAAMSHPRNRKSEFTTGPLEGIPSSLASTIWVGRKKASTTGKKVPTKTDVPPQAVPPQAVPPQAVPPQIQPKPPITSDAAQIAGFSKTQNGQNVTVVAPTNTVSAPVTNSVTNNFDKSVSIGTAQSARMSEFGGMWNSIVPQC
jgi:hypothetical protein